MGIINTLSFVALLVASIGSLPVQAAIKAEHWGVTADDGRSANLYTLTNAHGMQARISNYGGVIVSLSMPDSNGAPVNVVQGFDSLTDYTSADYIRSNGHDLIGSFCTKRIDRNWLGKELSHAEEETYPGADCDAAAAD